MRTKFWVEASFAGLALVFALGWYRERHRADTATSLQAFEEDRSSSARPHCLADPVNVEVNDPHPKPTNSTDKLAVKEQTSEMVVNDPVETTQAASQSVTPVKIPRSPETPIDASQVESRSYTDQQLEIYRCSNQMLEISMATERWAANHDGLMPHDLNDLSGYVAPMTLVCPGIHPAFLTASWNNFNPKEITYRINPSTRGAQWDFRIPNQGPPPSKTWLQCPFHKTSTLNRVMPGGIPPDQVFQPLR